jgi:hypothetical protein
MRIMEPAAFIMTRRMLLGLKQRGETLQASAAESGGPPRTGSATRVGRTG